MLMVCIGSDSMLSAFRDTCLAKRYTENNSDEKPVLVIRVESISVM